MLYQYPAPPGERCGLVRILHEGERTPAGNAGWRTIYRLFVKYVDLPAVTA